MKHWTPIWPDPAGPAPKGTACSVARTACTFYLFRQSPQTLRVLNISAATQADLLVGSPAYEDGKFFNRAYLLRSGRTKGDDKVHLVPLENTSPWQVFGGLFSATSPPKWGTSALVRR